MTKDQLWFELGDCVLGKYLISSSAKGIRHLWIGDDYQVLTRDFLTANVGSIQVVDQMVFEVEALHRTIERGDIIDASYLDIVGTSFQRKVWDAIRTIPVGKTWSYTELADKLSIPTAIRAVATACGANNVAVLVPCHRVIGASGALSGYRWGIDRKRRLLDIERRVQQRDV